MENPFDSSISKNDLTEEALVNAIPSTLPPKNFSAKLSHPDVSDAARTPYVRTSSTCIPIFSSNSFRNDLDALLLGMIIFLPSELMAVNISPRPIEE